MEEQELLNQLLKIVNCYDKEMKDTVRKAYDYAYCVHGTQRRKSGELYIVHPLHVAIILAKLQADRDVICAALLHDVIEDGESITKEDLKIEFNKDIAILVDGVTKMRREQFSDKSAQNYANIRKILRGIMIDPRIIMIKLADRLHNMRTLMYLPRNKQIENSIETLEILVPLAEKVGLHQLKNELEDLAFQYLNYDIYQYIQDRRQTIIRNNLELLEETKENIHENLTQKEIKNEVSYRIKNTYAIYQKLLNDSIKPDKMIYLQKEDINLSNNLEEQIHDIRSLKILVSNIEECYSSKEIVKSHFEVMKEKDCIKIPKTNGYQSLHTTIYGEDGLPIQTKIRTFQMEKYASYGLATYWKEYGKEASSKMAEKLQTDCPFYKYLMELDDLLMKDEDFVNQAKEEVLSSMIYPHTKDGKVIELPFGATPVDFAYQIFNDIGKTGMIALVNGKYVPLNYQLSSKDTVEIIPTLKNYLMGSLSSYAITTCAKQKIRTKEKRT